MAIFERSRLARVFYGTAEDTKPTDGIPVGSKFVEFRSYELPPVDPEDPEEIPVIDHSSGNVYVWTGWMWAHLWAWEGSVPNI